jgi:predicted GTPase
MATPVNLERVITIQKPVARVTYELSVRGRPDLSDALSGFA